MEALTTLIEALALVVMLVGIGILWIIMTIFK